MINIARTIIKKIYCLNLYIKYIIKFTKYETLAAAINRNKKAAENPQ